MLVGAGGAFGASLTQAPRYQSSTQLLIGGAANESDNQELVARQLAAQRAGAYSLLLPAPPAVAEVARRAGVPGAPAVVTATADGTSAYIDITVTAGSPQVAQKIAAAYGTATPEVVAMLEQRPGTASVRVTVTVEAALPSAPISPNPPRNAAIGLAIGLLVGLAGALAREALDARVRDSSEIERLTGATLLGSIPKEHGADVLPSVTRPRSGRAEAYRHVRTNLEFTSVDGMPRSVVVTSAAPGEGKSTTAANLAVVAARSGRNVVLVDADLRKRKLRDKVPMTFVSSEPYVGHMGLGGVGDSRGLMEAELRQRHIKWIVNSKVGEVRDGEMTVVEHDARGQPTEQHALPFKFAMLLPAFKGVDAVAAVEGLCNPRASRTWMP